MIIPQIMSTPKLTSWAMRIPVHDIDKLSDGCRGRFIESFLAIMAERLAMLGQRLTSRV